MNQIQRAVQSLAISAIVLGFATTTQVPATYAETYIAGQFGVTLPMVDGGLKSIDVNSSVLLPGTTHSDLELSKSVMYGGKVGHYFNAARWIGVEAEAFYTTPHIEQQVHTFQNPAVPGVTPSATLQGAHFRVLTVAPINVMLPCSTCGRNASCCALLNR